VLYCLFQDIICRRVTVEHLRLEDGNGHSNESQRSKSGDSDGTNKISHIDYELEALKLYA